MRRYRAIFGNRLTLENDSVRNLKSAIEMELRCYPESVIDKYGFRCLVPIYDNYTGELLCAYDSISRSFCRFPEALWDSWVSGGFIPGLMNWVYWTHVREYLSRSRKIVFCLFMTSVTSSQGISTYCAALSFVFVYWPTKNLDVFAPFRKWWTLWYIRLSNIMKKGVRHGIGFVPRKCWNIITSACLF